MGRENSCSNAQNAPRADPGVLAFVFPPPLDSNTSMGAPASAHHHRRAHRPAPRLGEEQREWMTA